MNHRTKDEEIEEALKREQFTTETLQLVDALRQERDSLKLFDRSQRMHEILMRLKHAQPTDVELVKDALVKAGLITRRVFNAEMKRMSGESEEDRKNEGRS